ncbi:MAG TPA: hypothetical protein VGE47_05630 [Burkholderiaceae bacterium]
MRRAERRILAFLSGLVLYALAVALGRELGGMGLVPGSVRAALGGAGSTAVLLLEALIYALPVFVLALAWAFITVRPWRKSRNTLTAWCLGGVALAWLAWLFYGVISFATQPPEVTVSISRMLFSPTMPPLFGVQFPAAIVAGVLLAGLLAQRAKTPSV